MNKIKQCRTEANLTQKQLAKIIGVAQNTIHYWENGVVEPDQASLINMSKLFDCSLDYLLGVADYAPDDELFPGVRRVAKKSFPMLGNVACGEPIYADENSDIFVDADANIDADFCLTAKGDSMVGARIQNGDIVFIKKQSMVNNGEIAAVIIGDEATLKRVYYYPEQSLLILRSDNVAYKEMVYKNEELDRISIIGKAVFANIKIK